MSDLPEALRRPNTPQSLWLTAMFVGGVFAPLAIWGVTGEPDDTVAMEQRNPAPAPELALEREALRALPPAAEEWFSDRFPLRHELIRAYSALIWFGLGQSAAPGMLRGRDEWLFFRGEQTLWMHRGNDFTQRQVDAWAERYTDWRDWLAARDVEYVFLIAPEKQSIYPELLPDWAGPRPERTRTDQVLDTLRARGLRIVDTRGPLLAAKPAAEAAGELLYYPFGTHWNDLGAFVAYRELMLAIAEFQPGTLVPERDLFREFNPRERAPDWTGDSFLVHMHLGDVVHQEAIDLEPTFQVSWQPTEYWLSDSGGMDGVVENAQRDLPTAVLLRDSFGEWLWKFMANHFSRLVSESWERFDAQLVEREAPDVVVSVRVERLFTRPLTPASVSAAEVAMARSWNGAVPVAEFAGDGERAPDGSLVVEGGDGTARLLLRFERAIERDRSVTASAETRDTALIGADGERHAVAVEFAAGRRWAFAGPVEVPLPARIELPAEGAPLAMVTVRALP